MPKSESIGANLGAGLFFTTGGLLLALGALRYPLGTASAMGPGYFPLILGVLLAVLGLIVLVGVVPRITRNDLKFLPDRCLITPQLRSFAAVSAAILLFAALLYPLGLLVTVPILVGVSSLASGEVRATRVAMTSAVLTILVYLIFVLGIGVRLPLLPGVPGWN